MVTTYILERLLALDTRFSLCPFCKGRFFPPRPRLDYVSILVKFSQTLVPPAPLLTAFSPSPNSRPHFSLFLSKASNILLVILFIQCLVVVSLIAGFLLY